MNGTWLAAAVAFVVVGIGTPLVGSQAFHGAAMVVQAYPWKADAPVSVVDDRFMPVNDTVEGTAPSRDLFARGLRDGEVHLWNPYPAGGKPLGSVPGSGLWTPWMAPFLLLPGWLAHGYLKLLELVVAGGGTFLFLRRLSLSRAACWAGALCFMSSGFLVAWTNWAQSTTAALVPAVFWATDRALAKRTVAAHALAALVFAWFVLSGFPAVVGFTMYVLVPFVALRAWWQRGAVRDLRWLRRGAAAGGALAVGVALGAFALLPFREWLTSLDLSYRDAGSGRPGAWRALLTLFAPYGFGSPVDGSYWGLPNAGRAGAVGNIVEAQVFVGAGALVLVAAAFGRRPAPQHRRVVAFFGVALVALALAIMGPDPWFAPLRDLPVLASNRVGRARAVLGFVLAVLAAFGVETLVSAGRGAGTRARWRMAAVAGASGALVGGLVVAGGDRAAAAGEGVTFARALALPAVAFAVAIAATVVAVRRPRVRGVALCVLALVVVVESIAFVLPFWPRTDPDHHYASTPTHEFLARNLGGDRMAAAELVMWPGTNVAYDLRAPTGHVFHDRRWVELLEAADPEVMRRPTVSVLRGDLDVVQSPVLDRIAVRYFVADPTRPVFGNRPAMPRTRGVTDLAAGVAATAPFDVTGVRAVVLRIAPGSQIADPDARIEVRIADAAGRVVATGRRRTFAATPSGRFEVPVAGEHLAGAGPHRVEASLASAVPTDFLRLATTADGGPVVGPVVPGDDGLRLAFADGAVVYERVDALARIRFATRAVAASAGGAAADLARGVPDDTVVLDDAVRVEASPPAGDPSPLVEVLADDPDEIRVRVRTARAGHLVVADAMQVGWSATLDGDRAVTLPADHALVAVAVPSGEHVVVLRYEPDGRSSGLVVSGGAATVVAGALVAGPLRRRARRRPARPAAAARPYDA